MPKPNAPSLRVGLVGYGGGYGWGLTRSLLDEAPGLGLRVVAVADGRSDIPSERIEKLDNHGVQRFGDAVEMFQAMRGQCDVMYIATGVPSHAPLLTSAVEAGYHVHLEKPPAATVQEVDGMIEAVRNAGVCCLVGYQAVHGRDVRFVEDAITAGRIGTVRTMVCRAGWPRNRRYYQRTGWAGRLRVGDAWVLDGPSTNALAHQPNNMLLWAGEGIGGYARPRAVRAELYRAGPIESHDTAAIEIQTHEGPRLLLLLSHTTAGDQYGPSTVIEGSAGRIVWNVHDGARLELPDGKVETEPADRSNQLAMFGNLMEAVRTGNAGKLRCDLERARYTTLALNAAHESSGRVHPIASDFFHRTDEGTDEARTVVEGLDELLQQAAEKACLLSDLPTPPPWAVATEAFDVAGYDAFPTQFTSE